MRGSAHILILTLFLFSFGVNAAELNTQCTKDPLTGEVKGLNSNQSFTIASVTKVFTTHWAVTNLTGNYRYLTMVHITPLGSNQFDVHLQGDLFPYFDRTMFQFLVGELNKLGIKNIHYMTYDENLLYASAMRTNSMLAHSNFDLTTEQIMTDFRQDTKTINTNLTALNAKAMALENLVLPKTLTLTIKDIHYLAKDDFRPSAQTKTYGFLSAQMYRVLKEMNRNSHNFAAVSIFKKLLQHESYEDFLSNKLPEIPSEEASIFNGSGYPLMIDGQKTYNSASCRAVVEVMADLREELLQQQMEFKDIMPVAGKDSSADGISTVTQIYGADQTNGALIAKTGSVNDTVALAGMISTENENTFFHTSFSTEQTPVDRKKAYDKIKNWIIARIGNNKKSNLDKYTPKTFMPFDRKSTLVPLNNSRLKKP